MTPKPISLPEESVSRPASVPEMTITRPDSIPELPFVFALWDKRANEHMRATNARIVADNRIWREAQGD